MMEVIKLCKEDRGNNICTECSSNADLVMYIDFNQYILCNDCAQQLIWKLEDIVE